MKQRLIVDSNSLLDLNFVNPALLSAAVEDYGFVGSPTYTLNEIGPDRETILRLGIIEISPDFQVTSQVYMLDDFTLSKSDSYCIFTAYNLDGVCLSDANGVHAAAQRLGVIVIGTLEFVANLVTAGRISAADGDQASLALSQLRRRGVVRKAASVNSIKKGRKQSYLDPRQERGEDRFTCNN